MQGTVNITVYWDVIFEWTSLYEIWYELYACREYPMLYFLNSLLTHNNYAPVTFRVLK